MEDNNTGMETSPLTQELYSIDWAVRFDEFRKYDQTSYTDLHQLLAKIENIVETEVNNSDSDLNDIKVLQDKFSKAKVESPEWHRLSMLIHLKIVLAAMPKGLTATATLSAIQIMEHLWKVSNSEKQASQSAIIQAAPKAKPEPEIKPAAKTAKPIAETAPSKKATLVESTPANKPVNTVDKQAVNNKNDTQTENVVIKKLAEEAGLEDKNLATRCYEVASSLADEYPEYTLTAIRVMTAEKLGVTRQFVENLDIKPARFKNG
jgi:ribosomal protein S24E